MYRRRKDGAWACLDCDASGRVTKDGAWIGEPHTAACRTGAGDDYGEAYGTLADIEVGAHDLLWMCEERWPVLNDGAEHGLEDVRRLAELLKPAIDLLSWIAPTLSAPTWGWESTGQARMAGQTSERGENPVQMLRAIYQHGARIQTALHSAEGRISDGRRHTRAEHAALKGLLEPMSLGLREATTIITAPDCAWNLILCPSCGGPCEEWMCCDCGHEIEPMRSEWERALPKCAKCSARLSPDGECGRCHYVDEGRRQAFSVAQQRTRAELRGRDAT